MGYMKTGFIVAINHNDNLGTIMDTISNLEWSFFLDEVPVEQLSDIRINALVTFVQDDQYAPKVATDIIAVHQLKKAV